MFKANDKNTRVTSMMCFYFGVFYVTHISSVSTVHFEYVNVTWLNWFVKNELTCC